MSANAPIRECPAVADAAQVLNAMLLSASRAPSGDNLQPWTFALDPGRRTFEVWLEESVDRTALNTAQGMSLIACGSALESAVCTASDHGWMAQVELLDYADVGAERQCIARIVIAAGGEDSPRSDWSRLITARTTNRRRYDGALLSGEMLERLRQATPVLNGAETHWIADRAHLESMARLLGRADAMLFCEEAMRRAFLKNVRFDLPADAPADWGLSIDTLEIGATDRLVLRTMGHVPGWFFRCPPARLFFASLTRKLVRSSTGLCVVAVQGEKQRELRAGRAMFRAWLALTELGLAVQPMMACIAMGATLEKGGEDLVRSLGREKLRSFTSDFHAALRASGAPEGSPQFAMRFGRAPAPSGRTGRFPIGKVLRGGKCDP